DRAVVLDQRGAVFPDLAALDQLAAVVAADQAVDLLASQAEDENAGRQAVDHEKVLDDLAMVDDVEMVPPGNVVAPRAVPPVMEAADARAGVAVIRRHPALDDV